ncbi:MAG TPA: winged helix-turn-helix domain-containing protein [Capillimicrobium sp.]|nr:winged helix-turn-helix domain-containing protein [Capillimicrobium sp.]
MGSRYKVSERDTALAKALSHPVRSQALRILDERVASPSEIAEELGLPVSNVAYHVRALLQLECIEEVATRPVRGALEHLYRAVRRPVITGDEWEDIPAAARAQIATSVFRDTLSDARAALEAGVFDAGSERHLSRTELTLDEEGWRTLNERLEALRAEALELQAAAARRLDKDGAGAVGTTLALLHFERRDEPAGE